MVEPAVAAKAIHWSEMVPWALSLLAIAVSVFNFFYAHSISRVLRKDAIARDAFNATIRGPIDRSLLEITTEIPKLRNLGRSYKALDAIKGELDELARVITEKADKLFEVLEDADNADTWISDQDWAEAAQAHWDRFLQAIELAGARQASYEVFQTHVGAAATALKNLTRNVKDCVTAEIKRQIERQ